MPETYVLLAKTDAGWAFRGFTEHEEFAVEFEETGEIEGELRKAILLDESEWGE